MLTRAAGSINFDADVEMVRLHLTSVEQAAQHRVLRASHCVKRPRTVESIAHDHRVVGLSVTAPEDYLNPLGRFARRNDPPGDNLEPAVADHARDGGPDLRRNAVTMDIPIRPRVP